eukprot:447237-Rhodomonas_salina.2
MSSRLCLANHVRASVDCDCSTLAPSSAPSAFTSTPQHLCQRWPSHCGFALLARRRAGPGDAITTARTKDE